MIIQEGKYYKARNGNKIGPMERYGSGWVGRDNDDPARRSYDADGYWYKETGDSEHDLFCPWCESPIQTETRRVLKPGVYGRVCVNEAGDGSGLVGIEMRPTIDPDELESAAMVLSQIAEFLREQDA